MFRLQLQISFARDSSRKSASTVDLRLLSRIHGARGIEGWSGVSMVKADGQGRATVVVWPLVAAVNRGITSPRRGQVARSSLWILSDLCSSSGDWHLAICTPSVNIYYRTTPCKRCVYDNFVCLFITLLECVVSNHYSYFMLIQTL